MSEGQLPAYVDTRRAFLQELEASGEVHLNRLPRFHGMLAGDEASIQVSLHFALNNEGQREITGNIEMTGEVSCQRCLEPVEIALQDQIRLILIDSEADAANLKPDWDPWLFEDYKLQLAEVVEEQLILSLPSVNYHSNKQCIDNLNYQQAAVVKSQDTNEVENPFAVLRKLKEE